MEQTLNEKLIDSKNDTIESKESCNLMHLLLSNNYKSIIEYFTAQPNLLNIPLTQLNGHTLLTYCVNHGLTTIISQVISAFSSKCLLNMDAKNELNHTPLQCALQLKQDKKPREVITILLKSGIDIDIITDEFNSSLLHWAVKNGYENIAEQLIKLGLSVDLVNLKHQTPLMIACINNEVKAVQVLLKYAANINAVDQNNYTAFMFAVANNHLRIISKTLKACFKELDLSLKNNDGQTILDMAAETKQDYTNHSMNKMQEIETCCMDMNVCASDTFISEQRMQIFYQCYTCNREKWIEIFPEFCCSCIKTCHQNSGHIVSAGYGSKRKCCCKLSGCCKLVKQSDTEAQSDSSKLNKTVTLVTNIGIKPAGLSMVDAILRIHLFQLLVTQDLTAITGFITKNPNVLSSTTPEDHFYCHFILQFCIEFELFTLIEPLYLQFQAQGVLIETPFQISRYSAIHYASMLNKPEAVEILIRLGANIRSFYGCESLIHTVISHQYAWVCDICKVYCEVTSVRLHCTFCSYDMCNNCLTKRNTADLNNGLMESNSDLFCPKGHLLNVCDDNKNRHRIIRMLVNAGLSIEIMDKSFIKPIHCAIVCIDLILFKVLIDEFNANIHGIFEDLEVVPPLICVVRFFHSTSNFVLYDFIDVLVKEHAYDINTIDQLGNTALIYAVRQNNLTLARYLLKLNANPFIKNFKDETAITIAEDKKLVHILQLLKGINQSYSMGYFSWVSTWSSSLNYVCNALSEVETKILILLLQSKNWIEYENYFIQYPYRLNASCIRYANPSKPAEVDTYTPLGFCCWNQNLLQQAKFLIEYLGADIEAYSYYYNNNNLSTLSVAIINRNETFVKYLLNSSKTVNLFPNGNLLDSITTFHSAIGMGEFEILELLIAEAVRRNEEKSINPNILNWACYYGFTRIVKELIEKYSFPVDRMYKYGTSALDQALIGNHPVSLFLLLSNGASKRTFASTIPVSGLCSELMKYRNFALNHIQSQELQSLLLSNENDQIINYFSANPGLLNFHCFINVPNERLESGYIYTPLMFCSSKNHFNAVKLLVEVLNADINVKDTRNKIALHYAVQNNCVEVVQYLAMLNAVNIDYQMVKSCIKKGQLTILDILLTVAPSLLNKANEDKNDPLLTQAAISGQTKICELLLNKYKQSIDSQNGRGNTALHLAIQYKFYETAEFLLEHNADITIENKWHVNSLKTARRQNYVKFTALIYQYYLKQRRRIKKTQNTEPDNMIAKIFHQCKPMY